MNTLSIVIKIFFEAKRNHLIIILIIWRCMTFRQRPHRHYWWLYFLSHLRKQKKWHKNHQNEFKETILLLTRSIRFRFGGVAFTQIVDMISTLTWTTLGNVETTLLFSTSRFTTLVNVETTLWKWPFLKEQKKHPEKFK